ncbi:RluA family pseudouridine synthase [Vagococcus elongatus]|uniref:Pseudouridine synthase n=1 Tax=Vagococcus elongatus TaxID=180344 RepID=A0A430B4B0_9ENTE|nr:RluA family pseudouridine synthase [Vagococcus elongatus]RSU15129.1 RNA pseudouridine synthase [Vagococcus elongatus]
MEFTWKYSAGEPTLLRTFLRDKGISRGLLAKIKFQGGLLRVNGKVENVLYTLTADDIVSVMIPDEVGHDSLVGEAVPLSIVFEDEHLLVVNKPSGVPSIPAQYHPRGTMANRVKGYYQGKNYADQVVHIVTRLDKDTTGLMLFAKHGYAHALMDKQLRKRTLIKKYQALVSGRQEALQKHGVIECPILRDETSLIKRKTGAEGVEAMTEYWLSEEFKEYALVTIQLHTGRTHQIRVHFAALGCPLVGDDLYGGNMALGLSRQALHCSELKFTHPFTGESLHLKQELPPDLNQFVMLGEL